MDIVAVFCDVDEFCQHFEPVFQQHLIASHTRQRRRSGRMHLSEILTILILFHSSHYRDFKHFYLHQVQLHLRREFPRQVCYNRFVELIPLALLALACYLQSRCGECTGISFVDSTSLKVCHNRRIHSHKVMAPLAKRGKTSTGWFYGFKLHLIVNDRGELLNVCLSTANTDDRRPVEALSQKLFGKLFGDMGYISQALFDTLFVRGLELITRLKRNMTNRLMSLFNKLLLRKRAIIETIIDQLKNICQIEHSRHRSQFNYFADILAGLIAYSFQDKRPSLNLTSDELRLLSNAIL
jgi:hypothetical protein